MIFETGSYVRSLSPKGNGGKAIYMKNICDLKPVSFEIKDTNSNIPASEKRFHTGIVVTFSDESGGNYMLIPNKEIDKIKKRGVEFRDYQLCNFVLGVKDNKKIAWIKPKIEDSDQVKVMENIN